MACTVSYFTWLVFNNTSSWYRAYNYFIKNMEIGHEYILITPQKELYYNMTGAR